MKKNYQKKKEKEEAKQNFARESEKPTQIFMEKYFWMEILSQIWMQRRRQRVFL